MNRIIRVHTFGINDSALNNTIRKLAYMYVNLLNYHRDFPYLYLFKACHTSSKMIATFLKTFDLFYATAHREQVLLQQESEEH